MNGHLHKPAVQFDFGGTLGNSVLIPAGACYYKRLPENPRYANSYNFVHLDFDRNICIVFLRRWSDSRTEWIKDIESYNDEGYCEFPLHMAVNQRSHPPPATSHLAPASEHFDQQTPRDLLRVTISASSDARLRGSRYSSIRLAVDAAKPGDTIDVAAGTYYENVPIDKSLTLNGAGAGNTIVDGNQAGSVFLIGKKDPNIDVALSGMKLTGGSGSPMVDPWPSTGAWHTTINGGGGILNYGRLKVKDSTISGNNAYEGGGIYNHGTLELNSGSIISDNTATFFGGGIVNQGTLTKNSASVVNNRAVQGGGITNGSILTIKADSVIFSNAASAGMGGGIWNRGTINLYDGSIEENKALQDNNGYGGDGGGICNDDPKGQVNIFGGKISGNSAWRGGGIYNYAGIVTMNGGSVKNNRALQDSLKYGGQGAGINNDGTFTMDGGSISCNEADRSGGGIYSYNGITIIKSGLISSNIAAYGYGGGIYSEAGAVTFDDKDLSINLNRANQPYPETSWYKGWGVFLRTGTPTIKGSFNPVAQITGNIHI